MAWSDNKHGAEFRPIDRSHFYSPEKQAVAYAERLRLLRLMADFDPKTKRIREPKHYDAPTGEWDTEERKCSSCKQPTRFRTTRGRPVHPACEGWIDTLSEFGQMSVIYTVGTVLTLKSVEVKNT